MSLVQGLVLAVVVAWQLYMLRQQEGASAGAWAISSAIITILISYWLPEWARPGEPLSFLPAQLVTLGISLTIFGALIALMAFQLHLDDRGWVLSRLRRPVQALAILGLFLAVIAVYAWATSQGLSIVTRLGMNAPSAAYALVDRIATAGVLAWVSLRSIQAARVSGIDDDAPDQEPPRPWLDSWSVDPVAVIAGVMVGVGTGVVACFTALADIFTAIVVLGGPVVTQPEWVGTTENNVAIVGLVGGYSLPVVVSRLRALGGWCGEANIFVQLRPLARAMHILFPEAKHPATPDAASDEVSQEVAARSVAVLASARPRQKERRPTLKYLLAGRVAECFDGVKRLDTADDEPAPARGEPAARDLAATLSDLLPSYPRLRETGLDPSVADNLAHEAQQDLHELKKLSRALVRRRPQQLLA